MIAHENKSLSAFLSGLSTQMNEKESSKPNVLAIAHYSGKEGDRPESSFPQYVLAETRQFPARWHDGRGLYTKQPGALSFMPADLLAQMRSQTPFELLVCLVDQSLLDSVERELDHSPGGELHAILNFHDNALQ